ncbi:MAG: pyridoxal-dependent decarboxylase [Hyphomicrobiaceae bacterium]
MDTNWLRNWGRRAADWGADYLATVRDRPVRARTAPGDIARRIPSTPPELAEDMATIFADFERIIPPGITHWQHPRFFAYFPANASPPSVVAEYLTAAIAAQGMLWQTSPAATELETAVTQWLRQMIGLSDGFHGVIQDTASTATFAAILTGREKALGFTGNAQGLAGQPPVRVYASDQVHSSIDKACWMAGIGQDNLVKVETRGPHLAMDPAALEAAIEVDRAVGRRPAVVVAALGGTSVGASDDIAAVAEVARKHGLHLHVDAAWAGSAMICPELRHWMAGAEQADSLVFNPHKWLMTNFDCSVLFLRDPEALVRTLGIRPSYLATHGHDGILNYSEWSPQLGRRFRALKLWFVIRAYGVEGLRSIIRRHIAMAERLAQSIAAVPGLEIVTPPMLSLFTFRLVRPGLDSEALDALNQRLLNAINDDGRTYLTPTRHAGQLVIRVQIGQTETTEADVDIAFAAIKELAGALA